MAGITLADAEAKLATWMAADEAVSRGQSYSIGNRSLSRVDAREISENIIKWNNLVRSLTPRSRNRTRYGVVANA
jgi:hypothetical protein